MIRRTKIVATLGPACRDPKVLERMINAGVDVVRINFSHGTREEHIEYAELTRSIGPLPQVMLWGFWRICRAQKSVSANLKRARSYLKPVINSYLMPNVHLGNQERLGLDYKELPNDVETGATLMLDDGRIVLGVSEVKGGQVNCVVEQGGVLSNNKGINRKGGGLSAPALDQ